MLDRLITKSADRPDHLYPEVALAAEQIYGGREACGSHRSHLQREQRPARWRDRLLAIVDPAEASRHQITQSTGLAPLPLAAMSHARSQDAAALQIADIMAGVCAEVLRSEARGRSLSEWVMRLTQLGIGDLVGHMVWREQTSPRTTALNARGAAERSGPPRTRSRVNARVV